MSGLTFRAAPGDAPVLHGATVHSNGMRIEGFRIVGTVSVEAGISNTALVSNDWMTDGRDGGTNLNVRAGVRGLLVEGNRLGQLAGVRNSNVINLSSTDTRAAIEDVTIRGNSIGPVPGGGDAIQAKHTRRLTIDGNEIFGLSRPVGSRAHPDAFQSIYGATDLVLEDNFIHDIAAQGVYVQGYRGGNLNVRAERNVITRVAYPWTAFSLRADGGYVAHNTIVGSMILAGTSIDAVTNIATGSLSIARTARMIRENYNLARRFTGRRGPNSMQGAPTFASPGGNDFSLLPSSLGKAAGPDGSDFGSGWYGLIAR